MHSVNSFCAALGLSLLVPLAAASSPSAFPPAYEDDYLIVHAGIDEIGTRTVHVGDPLTLTIDIGFDAQTVRIETLGSDYFQRALAPLQSARLLDAPVTETREERDGRIRVSASAQFQILDCPPEMIGCPGTRSYDLPVITVAYQVGGNAGQAASERSARFRPWPETIELIPAVSLPGDGPVRLASAIPGSAYPRPASVEAPGSTSGFLVLAGVLLAAFGTAAIRRKHLPESSVGTASAAGLTRWQRAAKALEHADMNGDEWADSFRRCIAWYCVDELGYNPYAFIDTGAAEISAGDPVAELQALFRKVIGENHIEPARRHAFISQFRRLAVADSPRG